MALYKFTYLLTYLPMSDGQKKRNILRCSVLSRSPSVPSFESNQRSKLQARRPSYRPTNSVRVLKRKVNCSSIDTKSTPWWDGHGLVPAACHWSAVDCQAQYSWQQCHTAPLAANKPATNSKQSRTASFSWFQTSNKKFLFDTTD